MNEKTFGDNIIQISAKKEIALFVPSFDIWIKDTDLGSVPGIMKV